MRVQMRTRFVLLILLALAPLGLVACVDVTPKSAVNEVGDVHELSVSVDTTNVEGPNGPTDYTDPWTLQFTVISGPNAGVMSDSDGDCNPSCSGSGNATVRWSYRGTGGVGTDTIRVCSVIPDGGEWNCEDVTKTWIPREQKNNVSGAIGALVESLQRQPTPTAVAPAAVAPGGAATLRPPSTGDAGLLHD
ncbi:MAG TPA: hypothetical protein VI759_04980 [Dehalococcoidia bacterium]|nr:hypothetical protein [Dehalococcoidia bacterium]